MRGMMSNFVSRTTGGLAQRQKSAHATEQEQIEDHDLELTAECLRQATKQHRESAAEEMQRQIRVVPGKVFKAKGKGSKAESSGGESVPHRGSGSSSLC